MPQSYSTAEMRRRYEARKAASVDILVRLKRGANPANEVHKGTEDVPTLKKLILEAYEEIRMLRTEKTALLLHLKGSVRFTEVAASYAPASRKAINEHLKVVETLLTRISGG